MKPVGVAAALLVLVLAPLAAAYGSGSALEADAPVKLEGRVDALVPKGLVSFVSTRGDDILLSLGAGELEVRVVTVPPPCMPTGVPSTCTPTAFTGTQPTEETHTLRDATLTIVKPLGAFKVVVTNDAEAYDGTSSFGTPGPLVTTTSAGTSLTTRASERYLSPFQDDWDAQGPTTGGTTGDVYTAAGGQGEVEAPGGTLRGAGGFQILLQGVKVKLKGMEDGKPFEAEYDTPVPQRGSDPTRYLTVQTPIGILNAASTKAPLLVHGVGLAETTGSASFTSARGELVDGGKTTAYEDEDVTLAGPIALTLTKVVEGDPMRLAFGISSKLRIADALPPPEEEEPSTAALVAAGAAGASSAGLLAAIAYFWPRLKLGLTLLVLPLYSRIERTAVLEHEKRDEIYGLIRATPGIHAHEIGEKAQIGWGTTVYHLKLLEQHSLIVSQKSGRYKRFFVNTGEYTKKKDVYGALRNETAKAVAQYIVDHPGVTQKDLCAALGIQPSLASWHVEKLEGVELVKRVKDGRMVRYFAGPAWAQLNVRIDMRGGGESVAET